MGLADLLPGGSSPAAVRRPISDVAFGGGSAEDWQPHIVFLRVALGLGPRPDVVEIILSSDSSAPTAMGGDSGTVSLGYADSGADLIFTGQVENVCDGVQGTTRITAVNGGAPLSRLRVNQSYEQQKAGDIVNDLAERVGVGTDIVEDGVDFPFYTVDDRRSAYEHIVLLAAKSGYRVYFNPEGELNFAPPIEGQAVQTFSYGLDIIRLEINQSLPIIGSMTVIGAGAAGSQGQEAWSWLVKDPGSVTAQAGNGNGLRLIQDPSLRSAQALQTAADGVVHASALAAVSGRILVAGAPAVVVGSTVGIADVPRSELNGSCLVRGVTHQYSKRGGFISMIDFSKAANGGALGGLG